MRISELVDPAAGGARRTNPQATPTTIAISVASERDLERRPSAVEHPREQVAAELVGAEQVRERRRARRGGRSRARSARTARRAARRPCRTRARRRRRRRGRPTAGAGHGAATRRRGSGVRDASSEPTAAALTQASRREPQARVDEAEEDVDDEARDDEHGRGEQHERLQHLRSRAGRPSRPSASRGPGRANTYSTITVPPMSVPRMTPTCVSAGIDAFGSMWPDDDLPAQQALSRRRPDVRRRATSASEALRMRSIGAATPIASVIAGSSADFMLSTGSCWNET